MQVWTQRAANTNVSRIFILVTRVQELLTFIYSFSRQKCTMNCSPKMNVLDVCCCCVTDTDSQLAVSPVSCAMAGVGERVSEYMRCDCWVILSFPYLWENAAGAVAQHISNLASTTFNHPSAQIQTAYLNIPSCWKGTSVPLSPVSTVIQG